MFKKKINCTICDTRIETGQFMAVIATSPEKEYVSSTISIINKWIKTSNGNIYCENCFNEKGELKTN